MRITSVIWWIMRVTRVIPSITRITSVTDPGLRGLRGLHGRNPRNPQSRDSGHVGKVRLTRITCARFIFWIYSGLAMFHFIQVIKEHMGRGSKRREKVKLRPLHMKMDYNLVNKDSE